MRGPKGLRSAILMVALCPLVFSGCFSTLVRWSGPPSTGQAIGAAALDIVTAPIQLLWAAGAGLDELRTRREKRAYEREVEKTVRRLREDPSLIPTNSVAFDPWDSYVPTAISRLVGDRAMPFTIEQLVAIDEIWEKQSARIAAGQGGWAASCPGLWARPEWTPEHLASVCGRIQQGPYFRRGEAKGYAANTNTPIDSLYLILAHDAGFLCDPVTDKNDNVRQLARSNVVSRITHDEGWRTVLRELYRVDEWAAPPEAKVTDDECSEILERMRRDECIIAKPSIEVFDTPDAARAALLERLGDWNGRCALRCRNPGDIAVGERCYADATGPVPEFVAFVRANALVTAIADWGSTPETLQAALWIDRKLCERLGLPPPAGPKGKGYDSDIRRLRERFAFGYDKVISNDERAQGLLKASERFMARLEEIVGKDFATKGPQQSVYSWDEEGLMRIDVAHSMSDWRTLPPWRLQIASDLVFGRMQGFGSATPADRARFCLDATAYASCAGVNAYVWDSFARPFLAEAFAIDPALRAEAEALGLPR